MGLRLAGADHVSELYPIAAGVQPLLSTGVTVTGAGDTFIIENARVGASTKNGIFQVSITGGTATIVLQGRNSEDYEWDTVDTLATNGGSAEVTLYREMRANVTAISGATVLASLNC